MTAAYVPQTFPRLWVPETAELKTWDQIEPWYQQLLDRPIDSPRGPRNLAAATLASSTPSSLRKASNATSP